MSISVKLEAFEGPLHLLLHLINKNKIDIYDIPIVQITEQYLEYVQDIQNTDLNIMSEFLVMAAYLLEIKSKMLLPREEEEESEDPRQELVERLLEYIMFKHISEELKEEYVEASRALYKPPTIPREIKEFKQEVDYDELLGELTLSHLFKVFQSIIKKQKDKIDPIRSNFGEIKYEEVNLSDKLIEIQKYGIQNRKFMFSDLIRKSSKMEVIVVFLGILELMKVGAIKVEQTNLYDDISIEYLAEDFVEIEEAD